MTLCEDHQVRLRRLAPRDLAAFQAYRQDPVVAEFQGWTDMTDAQSLRFLTDMQTAPLPKPGGWCQIGIAQTHDDQLIGDCGLHLNAQGTEAELGITLSRTRQGRGLGFAAVQLIVNWIFAQTDVAKVVAITDARNQRAQALLQHLGWPHVGTLGPDVEIVGRTEYVFEMSRRSQP